MNANKQDFFDHFKEKYISFMPQELLSFFTPEDLDSFLGRRLDFVRQRQEGELKIHINSNHAQEWQTNKTVVEILYEDMNFLVDSLREYFTRKGYELIWVVHPNFALERDPRSGELISIQHGDKLESYIYLELSHISSEQEKELEKDLREIYDEIGLAVQSFQTIHQVFGKYREQHFPCSKNVDRILGWLFQENLILLGASLIQLNKKGSNKYDVHFSKSYGLFRHKKYIQPFRSIVERVGPVFLSKPEVRKEEFFFYHSKITTRVEKNSEINFLFVRGRDEWLVLVGDFATRARNDSVEEIPLVHDRYAEFVKNMGQIMGTHSKRMSRSIFNYMPIEMKFALPVKGYEEVFNFLSQVYFHRRSTLNISWFGSNRILVVATVPENKYSQERQNSLEQKVKEFFSIGQVNTYVQFESDLVKTYYMVYLFDKKAKSFRPHANKFLYSAERLLYSWQEELEHELTRRFSGDYLEDMLAFVKKEDFDNNYINNNTIDEAIGDIPYFMELNGKRLSVRFCGKEKRYSLRLFSLMERDISEIMPILSNFGLSVKSEVFAYISSYGVYTYIFYISQDTWPVDPAKVAEGIRAAFFGQLTSDSLNKVLMTSELDWMQMVFLKAIRSYALQTSGSWSYLTLNKVLVQYQRFLQSLILFLENRFVWDRAKDSLHHEKIMEEELARVNVLLDDQILRQLLGIAQSMLRTNYLFMRQQFADLAAKADDEFYISFKLDSSSIPVLVEPRPLYEIYVYSSLMKGVHLRGGKVARGGLRWSDRPDDFRLEVLGLMKTQMVKNAVIVPVGSKGGFVVKYPSKDREESLQQGIKAYRTFISGLLELTDNYQGSEGKPVDLVRMDDFDPYLVVAADKGTASFSDIANGISDSYGFWLSDAFASGGSAGYNHKDYGITANGSWESVKRHFFELGIDVHRDEFTVAAIGDMAGDVFGNGMLYSDKIKLLAAFNHKHIFIDPAPDPARSYSERKRLFDSENGGWDQYDTKLISKGGGIFSRNDNAIQVTPEMAELFLLKDKSVSGPDLIQAILKMEVDLLYNGGIGTYVKAASESHAQVGDKANDNVRVDGIQLRARIIGEGGNLGLTQLGRIEFSQNGGRVFTDALDNSGGVDMSDHEVNLKILMQDLLAQGRLKSMKERNHLLKKIGDDVAFHVLRTNYLQALSVSMDHQRSVQNPYPYISAINFLEEKGILLRNQEFIPDNEALLEGKKNGLARPILAVLLGYVKMYLYQRLLEDESFNPERFAPVLYSYFPPELVKKYKDALDRHKLKNEITTTVMTNNFINILGASALFEISRETQEHGKIVHDYYLLNLAIEGIEFRKAVYAKQGEMVVGEFNELLLANAGAFREAIAYVRMLEIFLDDFYLDGLQYLVKNKAELLPLTPEAGRFEALAKLDEDKKRLFLLSQNLKNTLQALYLMKGKGKQSKNPYKDLLPLMHVSSWLDYHLALDALFAAVKSYTAQNVWEIDFRRRLLKRMEFDKIKLMRYLYQKGLLAKDQVYAQCEVWSNKNPLFQEIRNLLTQNRDDLLFYEYMVEKSLGFVEDGTF